jgi:hypothetical protein
MQMKKLTPREKSILAGLYLSKFDFEGLKYLGFDNFKEAFNVIGLAMGVQPASVKNYRDEFDPLFPNERKGWHKREIRKYCKDIYDTFHTLNLADFSNLIKDVIYKDHELDVLMEEIAKSEGDKESSFAKRLITGQAAEQYFRDNFLNVDLFKGYKLEDTTKVGCGFDFKLVAEEQDRYFGVEVKGLNEQRGNIALTNKEHTVAGFLEDRYFIFVVRNFKEKPSHNLYRDPISSLIFKRNESMVTQINWNTTV